MDSGNASAHSAKVNRLCTYCGTAFEPTNGRQRYCGRKCYMAASRDRSAKYQAAYRAKNREKIAKRNAAYQAKHRKSLTKYQAAYYVANKESIVKRKAAYRAKNREKIAKCKAAYRAKHRKRLTKYQAAYYVANKERIAKRKAAYRAAHRDRKARRRRSARGAGQSLPGSAPLAPGHVVTTRPHGMTAFPQEIGLQTRQRAPGKRLTVINADDLTADFMPCQRSLDAPEAVLMPGTGKTNSTLLRRQPGTSREK